MDVVKYSAGDLSGGFGVEVNAAKTFKEFYEHEKHHGFTKDQLKEIHDLCKKNAKKISVQEIPDERPE